MFYDQETAEIVEADIAINPHPIGADGTPLQFSTDGTPGTYDLESTLMHEIGHFLGLDHSNVIGSTMQPHQGVNGTYRLPAFTGRTLSEDDRSRVLSLYGSTEGMREGLSAIEGKLTNSSPGGYPVPLQGAHVWVEESGSGRVSPVSLLPTAISVASIPASISRANRVVDGLQLRSILKRRAINFGSREPRTYRARRLFAASNPQPVRRRAESNDRITCMVPPQMGQPF